MYLFVGIVLSLPKISKCFSFISKMALLVKLIKSDFVFGI